MTDHHRAYYDLLSGGMSGKRHVRKPMRRADVEDRISLTYFPAIPTSQGNQALVDGLGAASPWHAGLRYERIIKATGRRLVTKEIHGGLTMPKDLDKTHRQAVALTKDLVFPPDKSPFGKLWVAISSTRDQSIDTLREKVLESGPDLRRKWSAAEARGKQIHEQGYQYRPTYQNSNTVAAEVTRAAGYQVPASRHMTDDRRGIWVPALGNDLKDDASAQALAEQGRSRRAVAGAIALGAAAAYQGGKVAARQLGKRMPAVAAGMAIGALTGVAYQRYLADKVEAKLMQARTLAEKNAHRLDGASDLKRAAAERFRALAANSQAKARATAERIATAADAKAERLAGWWVTNAQGTRFWRRAGKT